MNRADADKCVELAKIRLPGEGPYRSVLMIRSGNKVATIRGHGMTKQIADMMALNGVPKALDMLRDSSKDDN